MSDDFGFGLLSEDDKLENFEKSTLKLILAQMGVSKPRIKGLEKLEEGFNTDWFNSEYLADDKLVITRIFKFNLTDVLYHPNRSEVITFYNDRFDEYVLEGGKPEGHLTVVFKVDGVGRMVATSWPDFEGSSVRIPNRYGCFFITPFPGFFSSWLGTNHEDI